MPTVITTPGEALRDTFRAWHAEHDSVDAQLRDSLEALSAYQSHLDQWQQQLARERESLRANQEELARERTDLQTTQQQFCDEREAAQAVRGDFETELAQLQAQKEAIQREQDELQALREALERDQAKADSQFTELNLRDDESRVRQAKLDEDMDALKSLRIELERSREETESASEQLKREHAELRVTSEKREQERAELKDAQRRLNHDRDELEASRRQLEHDRDASRTKDSATEDALKAELHAAREKIGSLTDNLLSRTEELRTLDIRRAAAVAELELVRAHEAELQTALEEHKRTAELDRLNWTAEVRQLHDLLQRRPEPALVETRESAGVQEPAVVPVTAPASNNKPVPPAVASRGNPVLGSIVQQFDKLRQQRATDRQTGQKPR